MRKNIFAALLILLGSTAAMAQAKRYQVAVVGFYNCENFYDTIDDPKKNDDEFTPNGAMRYGTAIYTDKVGRLASVLSEMGKDVTPDGLAMFGLAEIENETVLTDLISQPSFQGRHYKIVHYDSPDERGVDVALIYNPKYFKVISSEPLSVALIEDGSPHPTRDILSVLGVLGGDTVNVFVNHWPSRRGGDEASAPYRAVAAGVARAAIAEKMKTRPDARVILMGDLNDDPTSPSVTKVLGAKGDKEKVGPGEMYNPWVKYYKSGIGTLAFDDSWNLFDQIMVSHGYLDQSQSGFFFSKAVIFKREFMITQSGGHKGYPLRTFSGSEYQHGYSDHFPTYIVLMKEVKK